MKSTTNQLINQSINHPMSKTACAWASGAVVEIQLLMRWQERRMVRQQSSGETMFLEETLTCNSRN
jgi:hypothetical protein